MTKKKGESEAFRLSEQEKAQLEREGADPRLTKTGARFNALVSRCLNGGPPKPLSEQSAAYVNHLDATMLKWSKDNGHEVDED